MKRVVLILEGAGESIDDVAPNDSPMHVARTPALDSLARSARLGFAQMMPEEGAAVAEASLAATLGVDPVQHPIGRGAAEAIALGIESSQKDAVLRASLVRVVDGVLDEPSPEPVRLAEVRGFLHSLNMDAPPGAEIVPGDGHRCILIVRGSTEYRSAATVDPQFAARKPIRDHLPRGRGSRILSTWMLRAIDRLADHELNGVRADLGEPEITGVWFWGGGAIPRVASWRERFGNGGEVVSASALMRGIGRICRLESEDWGQRPPDRHAELARTAERALAAIERRDFVCVHSDWPDWAGHRGDRAAKIAAIEACDHELVAPLVRRLEESGEWRLLVTTAHCTPTATRQHSPAPAPILVAGAGIESNRGDRFDEISASGGEIHPARGSDLIEYFMLRA